MKKYFLSMMSIMMMALVCVGFSACGDDDDNNNNGGNGGGNNSGQQVSPQEDYVGEWLAIAFTPEGGKRIEINRSQESVWEYYKRYNITANGKIEEWSINYRGDEEIRGREEKTLVGKYRIEGSTFIIYDFYEGYNNVKAYEQEGGGTMSKDQRRATVSISNSIFFITVDGYGTYELKKTSNNNEGGNGGSSSITGDGETYEFDYGYWYAYEVSDSATEYVILLFNCAYYEALERQDASMLPNNLQTMTIMFDVDEAAAKAIPAGDYAPFEALLASLTKQQLMEGEKHGKQYTAFSENSPVKITKSGDKYTISLGELDFYEMFSGDRENVAFTSKPFTFTGTLSQVPEKYFQYE